MCRKTIYYNTYDDGREDVTERVDTCRPGRMCSRPEVRQYARRVRAPKHPDQAPYTGGLAPPTPRRSKSPSPDRRRESGIFVNGTKIADVAPPSKRHSTTTTTGRDRPIVVPHAPEPPSPRPAAAAAAFKATLRRSNTLPGGVVLVEEHKSRRRQSRDIPLGPVQILDDLSRRRQPSPSRPHSSDSSSDASTPPTHWPRHAPRPYVVVEDPDAERAASRRRRRAQRTASLVVEEPAVTNAAGAAPRKELRWRDIVEAQIAAQNERIAARRASAQVHQDKTTVAAAPRGILKKPTVTVTAPDVDDRAVYEELRRAVAQMDINRPQRRGTEREREERREKEEGRYWDRLRERFEDPGERRRRRSRVYYPEEGIYRYM